jgi:uncharacterized membrane protein YfcA
MVTEILRVALVAIGIASGIDVVRVAIRKNQLGVNWESATLGAITNFFDTLGIGSFAPTTAWLKFRKIVPDSFIPGTLNAGHTLPTVVEALIFIVLVPVDPWLLVSCIGAAVAGSIVGAPLVTRAPVRVVQSVVGVALIIAAVLLAMKLLSIGPANGNVLSLQGAAFAIAVVAHFIMGILMAFGIGLYAPSLIVLSLLGLNPKGAFPIMMGACAFLMPGSGARFIRTDRIDLRVVLGIALGGVPAVLIAAYIVKSLPLYYISWGVVVVVLYAAALLLRSAMKGADVAAAQPAASGAQS